MTYLSITSVFTSIALCTLCIACGNQSEFYPEHETTWAEFAEYETMSEEGAQPGSQVTRVIQNRGGLKDFSVYDPTLNARVSTYRIPENWSGQSRVTWNERNISNPLVQTMRLQNGSGDQTIELFPNHMYCWIEPSYYLQEGQNMQGAIVMRPREPASALINLAVKPLRKQKPNFRVIEAEQDPSLNQRFRLNEQMRQMGYDLNQMGMRPTGVRVLVSYTEKETEIHEEFVCFYLQGPTQREPYMGQMTQTNWFLLNIFGIKAPKNRFDQTRNLAYQIIRSANHNAEWARRYQQKTRQIAANVDQYIQQGYASIRSAGQLSKSLSAQNDAFLNGISQQMEAERNSYSSADKFSDYIRGVERVDDPYWGEGHQINGGYQNNWTDGYGNYIQTNDAGYNPNSDLNVNNQNWQLNNPN